MRNTLPVKKNIFKNIPVSAHDEITEILAMKGAVRIERIVSTGQASPEDFFYDQDEDEFIIVLKGRAVMSFSNGSKITLNEGDHFNIPKNLRHRVDFTEDPTIWLAVFY
ncbi:MAG TPA: cupin domain-containing protein [bacterium]|nr:cupin domain-containing protein [bacterium]